MVRWTWWDLSLILRTNTSFSASTLLVGLFSKPVPDMTYNVFSGTFNPAQSISISRKLRRKETRFEETEPFKLVSDTTAVIQLFCFIDFD